MSTGIQLSPEVVEAQDNGKPVVALESTVFSSLGLPSPANKEAYERSLQEVQEKGAVAAVTAVIDGKAAVGLDNSTESRLLSASEVFTKVSMSNLPVAIGKRWSEFGATTVSASLLLAHQADIKVFATGGIGGVHRENAEDVSADLMALSRFPVATVCSGAKAFLDLPATVERLETLGVAVVGYSTGEFPAFWCQESGLEVQHSVNTPEEAADIVRAIGSEQGSPGVLFAVPPPKEKALQWSVVEQAVEEALDAVQKQGIQGGAVTPYILERINQATNGGTLPANIALVANNAAVAADIAVALAND